MPGWTDTRVPTFRPVSPCCLPSAFGTLAPLALGTQAGAQMCSQVGTRGLPLRAQEILSA